MRNDEYYMKIAIAEARKAEAIGESSHWRRDS